MTQCPYPETIRDEDSGVEVPNDKYQYWHEGYEAHKFEMANLSVRLALLAQGLEDEIIRFKQLGNGITNNKTVKKVL